jgi:hypothetical protein
MAGVSKSRLPASKSLAESFAAGGFALPPAIINLIEPSRFDVASLEYSDFLEEMLRGNILNLDNEMYKLPKSEFHEWCLPVYDFGNLRTLDDLYPTIRETASDLGLIYTKENGLLDTVPSRAGQAVWEDGDTIIPGTEPNPNASIAIDPAILSPHKQYVLMCTIGPAFGGGFARLIFRVNLDISRQKITYAAFIRDCESDCWAENEITGPVLNQIVFPMMIALAVWREDTEIVTAKPTPGLQRLNERLRMRGLRAISPIRTIHLTQPRKVYVRKLAAIRKAHRVHEKGRHERHLTEMTYTRTLKSGKVVQCRRRAQTIIVKPNSPPAMSGRSAPVYLPVAPRVIRVEA